MKKYYFLLFGFLLCLLSFTKVNAQNYEVIPETSTYEKFSNKTKAIYSVETSFPSNTKNDIITIKLNKDSFIKFNNYYSFNEEPENSEYLDECYVELYKDDKCTNMICSLEGPDMINESFSKCLFLKAGTYYIKISLNPFEEGCEECSFEREITAVSIPISTIRKVKKVEVNSNTKLTWENILGSNLNKFYYNGKSQKLKSEVFSKTEKTKAKQSFKIKIKNSDSGYDTLTWTVSTKKDNKAPTVKGIKNNKTYSDKVKIYAYDDSGIKKATIDNKKIKISKLNNGLIFKKKGNHTFKIWDKKGNLKTIKFKIK